MTVDDKIRFSYFMTSRNWLIRHKLVFLIKTPSEIKYSLRQSSLFHLSYIPNFRNKIVKVKYGNSRTSYSICHYIPIQLVCTNNNITGFMKRTAGFSFIVSMTTFRNKRDKYSLILHVFQLFVQFLPTLNFDFDQHFNSNY